MTAATALGVRRATAVSRAAVTAVAAPLLLGLAGFGITVAFTWVPYGWSDEAATQTLVTRPLGDLWQTVTGHIDAVHAAYYLCMRMWVSLFGASIPTLRVPSAIAVGIATAGVHTLGKRLGGPRVALVAALLFLTVPMVTWAAGEARSYAWTMAAAVWLSVLLLWAASGRKRRWVVYALAAAASAYLFLYLLLVVIAHVLAVLGSRALRRHALPAIGAAVAAGVAALPLVVTAARQQQQVGWIAPIGPGTAAEIGAQWFIGGGWYELPAWLLITAGTVLLAVRRADAPDERRGAFALLVLWLVLPTAVLVAVSALGKPAYLQRYTLVSLPAAALLMGFACERLKRLAAVVVVIMAALAAPVYLQQRSPLAKRTDWGEDAAFVHQHAVPGAGFYFADQYTPRSPRRMLPQYSADFAGLVDIGLARTGAQRQVIWDTTVPPAAAAQRAAGLRSLIVIGDRVPAADLRETLDAFRAAGLHVTAHRQFSYTAAYVLER